MHILLHVVALVLLFMSPAKAKDLPASCGPATATGVTCTCDVNTLRPLQGAIGLEQVRSNVAEIKSRPDHEWKKLGEDPIKVVQGPGGALFITDHHHGADAWRLAGHQSVLCQIVKGPPAADEAAFWAGLQQAHLVRLADAAGKPISPAELPRNLASMPDDPYRTLAGLVRRKGGFCRSSTQPEFAEFAWADWLRTRPELPVEKVRASAASQLDEALILVRLPDAKAVPGWIGDKENGTKCP